MTEPLLPPEICTGYFLETSAARIGDVHARKTTCVY